VPTFDVVSEVDMQEVRNAVDQASREAGTRFDFKGTDSSIELSGNEIVLESATEDRLKALSRFSKRSSCGARSHSSRWMPAGWRRRRRAGPTEVDHTGGHLAEHGKRINKIVKDLGLKGVSSSVQGDQVRVSGKKRDDLQA